jgi:hypothetical protein
MHFRGVDFAAAKSLLREGGESLRAVIRKAR